jgi:hypothetical protein
MITIGLKQTWCNAILPFTLQICKPNITLYISILLDVMSKPQSLARSAS